MREKKSGLHKDISSILGEFAGNLKPKGKSFTGEKLKKKTGLVKDIPTIFNEENKKEVEQKPSSVLKKTSKIVSLKSLAINKMRVTGLGNRKTVFGLDIGTNSLKMIWSERDVIKTAIYEIPAELPEFERYQAITEGIKRIIKEGKISLRKVNCVISGDYFFTYHFSLPLMGEEELKKTVSWEAKKYLPPTIRDTVLDFVVLREIVDKGIKKKDIILVAAEKETFAKYLFAIRKAGLKPLKVEAIPFALLNVFQESGETKSEDIVALIDIGTGKTNISIIKDNLLLHNRQILIGGNNITKILSHDLILDFKKAEELKRKEDLFISESYQFTVIRPVLEQLLKEIERSFDLFFSHSRERVKYVLISGGGAKLKGLDEYLSKKLGLEVKVYKPTIGNERLDPQFVVAAGVTLGGTKGSNLLSPKVVPQKKRFLWEKILSKNILTGVISVLLGTYICLSFLAKFYERQLTVRKASFLQLNSLVSETKNVAFLKCLVEKRLSLPKIFAEISKLIPQDVWLRELSFKKGEIKMTGGAFSNQSVTNFLTNLGDSTLFKNVKLISTKKVELSKRNIVVFEIEYKPKFENAK